jgi:hypothetical protein
MAGARQIILCSACEAEVHMQCIDPGLTEVPDKDWFCSKCKAKRVRRRRPTAGKGDELEDKGEGERNRRETKLLDELVQQKVAEKLGQADPDSSQPTCEYCGYSMLELCSPMVMGQSWAETEEHIRMATALEASKREEQQLASFGKRAKRKVREGCTTLPPTPHTRTLMFARLIHPFSLALPTRNLTV